MVELAGASIQLNEYEGERHQLLQEVFPKTTVPKHNAEYLNSFLQKAQKPLVMLRNPALNRSTMVKSDFAVTGRHIRSALSHLRDSVESTH